LVTGRGVQPAPGQQASGVCAATALTVVVPMLQTDNLSRRIRAVSDERERIRVREAMVTDAKLVRFRQDTPLAEILEAVADSKQQTFPVLDEAGALHGVIYFDDIRVFFVEHRLPPQAVIAQDLLAIQSTVVSADEDLASALRKFRLTRHDELPVVERCDLQRVIGVLNRRDVIAAYHDRVHSDRPPEQQQGRPVF